MKKYWSILLFILFSHMSMASHMEPAVRAAMYEVSSQLFPEGFSMDQSYTNYDLYQLNQWVLNSFLIPYNKQDALAIIETIKKAFGSLDEKYDLTDRILNQEDELTKMHWQFAKVFYDLARLFEYNHSIDLNNYNFDADQKGYKYKLQNFINVIKRSFEGRFIDKIDIFIKPDSEKQIPVEMYTNIPFLNITDYIILNALVDRDNDKPAIIIFAGKEVFMGRNISYYHIKDGSTLHLMHMKNDAITANGYEEQFMFIKHNKAMMAVFAEQHDSYWDAAHNIYPQIPGFSCQIMVRALAHWYALATRLDELKEQDNLLIKKGELLMLKQNMYLSSQRKVIDNEIKKIDEEITREIDNSRVNEY